jgi:hypothetical protein
MRSILSLPLFLTSLTVASASIDEWGKDPDMVVTDFTPLADSIAGGQTCPEMQPFCPNDGTQYSFFLKRFDPPVTTSCPCNFGCLSTHPGEQWLYINIASSGDMKFLTESVADHDYAIWGPYDDKDGAVAGCNSLPEPKDCSFDPQEKESHNVNNVQAGKTYILVLTNYANQDQSLTATIAPGNTAGYDCQDVIDILQPTQNPTPSPPPTTSPTLSPTNSPTPRPNDKRCECWHKPDLIACPIVRMINHDCEGSVPWSNYCGPTECGGGSGIYDYQCSEEEQIKEKKEYVLWNILPFVYKLVFLSTLRLAFGCTLVDFGVTDILCFSANNSLWFLLLGNVLLLLLIYLSRCFMPLWALFMLIWLHFDCVLCIVNRYLNIKPVAPPKPNPPRSNLELFAYTNHKKSWKEKAYATVELRKHKKDAEIERKNMKKSLVKKRDSNFRGGAF